MAVLVFVLNQWGMVRAERRRARLERVDAQIRELYGPLKALAGANEAVWRALRAGGVLPDTAARRSGEPLAEKDEARWQAWAACALMPTNRRMRELILGNAHMFSEGESPEPLLTFCAHVAALEAATALRELDGAPTETLVHHPGRRLTTYLDTVYAALKREQARLIDEA